VSPTPPEEPPVAPKMILTRPPGGKRVNDMTDDEIYAWAKAITDFMQVQRPIVDAAGAYLRAKAKASQ